MGTGVAPFPKLLHATRSEVFTALLNLLATLPAPPGYNQWNLVTQTVELWDNVPKANQPAIILVRGPQNYQLKAVATSKVHWRAIVLIYFRTENYKTRGSYPDEFTDVVLDSLEQLFTPLLSAQYFTLGGLVQNVFIDGSMVSDPGLTDNQAVCFIPLSIFL